jgi:hypothetical protein
MEVIMKLHILLLTPCLFVLPSALAMDVTKTKNTTSFLSRFLQSLGQSIMSHPTTIDSKGPLSHDKLPQKIVKRFIFVPLQHKSENSDHKAPRVVQKLAIKYAKAMCPKYNPLKRLRVLYFTKLGYFTVYDGAGNDEKDIFSKHPTGRAYTSLCGGIFFPKQSLCTDLTPEQKQSLAHEVGHVINGDTTKNLKMNLTVDDKEWYKREFLAQQQSLKILAMLDTNAFSKTITNINECNELLNDKYNDKYPKKGLPYTKKNFDSKNGDLIHNIKQLKPRWLAQYDRLYERYCYARHYKDKLGIDAFSPYNTGFNIPLSIAEQLSREQIKQLSMEKEKFPCPLLSCQ